MTGPRRFARENLFLVAAAALPLLVIGLFLLASAVPRWLVAPPSYDLIVRVGGQYSQSRAPVAVDFAVRDGRVEATVRPLPQATGYAEVPRLFLFDHETMNAREIRVDLPANLTEGDPPVTVPVEALAGRRVLAETKAPDGYEFQTGHRDGPGLIGGIFGMRRHGERVSVVNKGRVVPIPLPSNEYVYGVSFVGWVLDEGSR